MLNKKVLKKDLKYIVGCSGGADSMALLDLMRKEDYDIVVCHVNYHMRETSMRDQKIVEDYCDKHHIKSYIYDSYFKHDENFENFARVERYQFYAQIANENKKDAVVIGHQKDDVLETYWLQKQRKIIPLVYGLNEISKINNITVIRPLLAWTKHELELYCERQHIPTGFDESNDQDIFARNRLRKAMKQWSVHDMDALYEEMIKDNERLSAEQMQIEPYVKTLKFPLKVEVFSSIPQSYQNLVLRYLLSQFGVDTKTFTKRRIDNILIGLNGKNKVYQLDSDFELILSYGILYLERVNQYQFSYIFDRIEPFKCQDFELTQAGEVIEGITLTADDFPITIRSGLPDDTIELRFGKKQLNRFWIDRKIPTHIRRNWLVIENKMKRIVFIHGLGCDIHHFSNKPNLFVIKYCSLEDENYASAR